MKRFIALVIALMLCALPALAELAFITETQADGSLVFRFSDLTMTFPADWAEKMLAMPTDGGLSFYQRASYEKYLEEDIEGGGYLFTLGASVNGSFSELPAFRYLGFSENSCMNYYMVLPTDYPAWMGDEAIRAEYDQMLAQVDAIADSVVIDPEDAVVESGGPVGEPPADGAGSATDAGKSDVLAPTLEEARYHFEHSAMPRYFYDDPANMLEVLSNNGVYRLWAALADDNGVAYPYHIGDFDEHWYDMDDGSTILQVVMPQPTETPQCYRLYMVYNGSAGVAAYYTVEYENLLGEAAFLCGWDAGRTHINYGGAAVLDPDSDGYEAALWDEAQRVAALAGVSGSIQADPRTGGGDADDLARIECPELGFATMADPSYAWDYREGTGVSIYTEHAGSIPYVIVWRGEDLIAEPLEYIKEQFTPHMREQYGDDLVACVEYERYEIGGKQLPAGLYTYRLQGYLVDMLRLYDISEGGTMIYTAKYIETEGAPTLAALDAAIRNLTVE